ncbi:cupin domain-containing protein [Acetobacterium malicum]|uniref:Cupin domain-containing protein n=2 Tax=Acetobacterium malicum TaxID=52692 RepID=A0ABR6YSZ1_9FIRM|nr:cupin domain-containing protein [Acetobacterium dehalogenans]MBC3898284.1 cupin domain-containing protein [Acetobacterium malicum]
MIIQNKSKQQEIKQSMRGGKGDIEITHITGSEILGNNCRLFAQITVKPGDSIGEHQHVGEREIFYFLQGHGIAIDNGKQSEIGPGDVMVTPDQSSHSVVNTGDEDLVFMALILNENS